MYQYWYATHVCATKTPSSYLEVFSVEFFPVLQFYRLTTLRLVDNAEEMIVTTTHPCNHGGIGQQLFLNHHIDVARSLIILAHAANKILAATSLKSVTHILN